MQLRPGFDMPWSTLLAHACPDDENNTDRDGYSFFRCRLYSVEAPSKLALRWRGDPLQTCFVVEKALWHENRSHQQEDRSLPPQEVRSLPRHGCLQKCRYLRRHWQQQTE